MKHITTLDSKIETFNQKVSLVIENRNSLEEEEIPTLYYGNQICMLNEKDSKIDPKTTKEEFDMQEC